MGQGAIVLATPLLSRIYSPAEFGTLAVLLTVGNIAMALGCLRYDMAIPSAGENEIRGLMTVSMLACLALAVIVTLCLALIPGSEHLGTVVDTMSQRPWLIGVCVAAVGIFQATNAYLLRQGDYRGAGLQRASQGIVFIALAAFPAVGVLWAYALSFLVAGWRSGRYFMGPTTDALPWRDAAAKHRQLPILSLPGAVLDVVGYSLCIWIVVSHYGEASTGVYSQVQRLIGAPMMLASISLGQIMLRHTAEIRDDKPAIRHLVGRLMLLMGAALVVALPMVWFAGADILRLFLGPKWVIDRELVVAVTFAVAVRACVSPLSTVLISLRRFDLALAWQILYFCSAATILPWLARHLDLNSYACAYAVHEAVLYGIYLKIILWALRK
ncbi:lipopolysaccharide biosynthesis protein [Pandoraea cepalis]|uniref:lipopolysaccharide biosynthesis protein n=1 Tax=Pandoraea cepalis TaxID=2508294 RepID=UPI00263AE511|nr:oligosaccharide flippase family protein [Pandoraea cepalis]